MRRWMALLLAVVCALCMTGCQSGGPKPEEVEKAIEEGNVTLEDALNKGWVTQEWADAYMEGKSVPAANKMEAHRVNEFTATTLAGETFTQSQMGSVAFFAFVDPADPAAADYFGELVKAYEGVREQGAEIVVCLKGETDEVLYTEAPFPVILYNDSVKQAVENNREMIEEMANTGSWYVDGAFLSAWYGQVDGEELPDSAAAFVQMEQDMQNQEDGSAAAVMG